jgi:hypothetical protein
MRISTRSCLDNDTFSKLFWILELPERTGLCKMDWDWVITRAFPLVYGASLDFAGWNKQPEL